MNKSEPLKSVQVGDYTFKDLGEDATRRIDEDYSDIIPSTSLSAIAIVLAILVIFFLGFLLGRMSQ